MSAPRARLSGESITHLLLVLVVLALLWLAWTVMSLHADIAPIVNSRLAGALANA